MGKYQSRFLYHRRQLSIQPQLAEMIGLNEAIVLQQINYWIITNEEQERDKQDKPHYRDGRWWTYNTYDEWKKQFPFWSINTIKNTVKSLKKKELIITGTFNKKGYDRTLWYTINYDKLEELEKEYISKVEDMDIDEPDEENSPETLDNTHSTNFGLCIVQNLDDGRDKDCTMDGTKNGQPIPNTTQIQPLNNIADKPPNNKKNSFTEEHRAPVIHLKEILESAGVHLERNWCLKNYAVSKRLQKDKNITPELLIGCIDWLWNDSYHKEKLVDMLYVELNLKRYQLKRGQKKPQKTESLDEYKRNINKECRRLGKPIIYPEVEEGTVTA